MAEKKVIVAFAAGVILANEIYDESEKFAISTVAKTLGFEEQEIFNAIDTEIAKQEAMSDEDIDAYLIDMAKDIDENDMLEIFQICLVIVLSDGILCKEETAILLSFANVLNIDTVYATMMIAYMVNKKPDIVIEIDLGN